MKRFPAGVILAAVLLSVCGCSTPQKFEDVSSAPAFRRYVDATYKLQVPMHLSGVSAPPGYGSVDYYVVNPVAPGWSGPEVTTRETLSTGKVVIVDAVRRCINCPFDDVVHALIRMTDDTTEFSRPIYIPLKYLAPDFATELKDENPTRGVRPRVGAAMRAP